MLLMTTLIPEVWPWLACHSGGAGFNEACVLWTLRDPSKLCGCCCMPRACHHSAVLFLNISAPQSNKLMPLTDRLYSFFALNRWACWTVNQSVHQSIGFSVLKILRLAYHHMSRWEGIQVLLPLSWVLHREICFDFKKTERLQLKNLYKWHIYSALMGSILTEAPGLGSGTGLYP